MNKTNKLQDIYNITKEYQSMAESAITLGSMAVLKGDLRSARRYEKEAKAYIDIAETYTNLYESLVCIW